MASAPADLELLVRASVEARSLADFELAERLGHAAVDQHPGAVATVDLAQTLHWRGQHRKVVALLSSGALDDAAGDDAGRGSVIAAQSWFFGLGDLDEAERWIERGIAQGGPAWAALLRGKHSQMLMNVVGRGKRSRRGWPCSLILMLARSRRSPRTRACFRDSPSRVDFPSSASTCRSHKVSLPTRLLGSRTMPTARSSARSSVGSSRAAFLRSIRCSRRGTKRRSGA